MSPEAFQDISHAPRFDNAGNAKPRMKVRTVHVCLFNRAELDGTTKVLKDVLNPTTSNCSVRRRYMMKVVFYVEQPLTVYKCTI